MAKYVLRKDTCGLKSMSARCKLLGTEIRHLCNGCVHSTPSSCLSSPESTDTEWTGNCLEYVLTRLSQGAEPLL
jgi:hypothetical protein